MITRESMWKSGKKKTLSSFLVIVEVRDELHNLLSKQQTSNAFILLWRDLYNDQVRTEGLKLADYCCASEESRKQFQSWRHSGLWKSDDIHLIHIR